MTNFACDTHVHVIGELVHYPMLAERRYTCAPVGVTELRTHLQAQGLGRVVLIQPSIYGTDNRCMIDALAHMPQQARGVAVLDLHAANLSTQIQHLHQHGVRGIRLNVESSGGADCVQLQNQIQAWGAVLAQTHWHIQIYAAHAQLAAYAGVIANSPVPVVLDHFAVWHDANFEAPEAHTLLQLFASGKIYIKLSASYRVPQRAGDLAKIAHRLLETRADRLLWGSDWPHTNREPNKQAHEISRYREIAATDLVVERESWLHTSALKRQVLIDNPARLYDFDA